MNIRSLLVLAVGLGTTLQVTARVNRSTTGVNILQNSRGGRWTAVAFSHQSLVLPSSLS
jgi:hypothetical protein